MAKAEMGGERDGNWSISLHSTDQLSILISRIETPAAAVYRAERCAVRPIRNCKKNKNTEKSKKMGNQHVYNVQKSRTRCGFMCGLND